MKLAALCCLCALPALAQNPLPTAEVRRFGVEVAGIRVGTMTATRQPQAGAEVLYTLVSDVEVNFLIYHLKLYYKVTNRMRHGQLMLSTVDARTNHGNFASRTEWKGDHYDIVAEQYKHSYRGTERQPITYTITDLFFGPPDAPPARAYSEYFGDYFSLSVVPGRGIRARRDGREDEYRYAHGQLQTLIKRNALKNFVVHRLQ